MRIDFTRLWPWTRLPRQRLAWLALVLGWLAMPLPAWCALPAAPGAEPRHALVIGNADYAGAPLLNSTNDARAVAKALQVAGFTVDLQLNATQREMNEAVTRFGDSLKGGGAGLFYFAGHGVQIKGRNFLVPVASGIQREEDVAYRAVDVQQVLDRMETAKNRINIVVLDACRDNPFAHSSRSLSGGLTQLDAPIGSLVAFATAPGSVASDGKGSNGLYTQHLLANIETPGLPIEEVFKRVRLGVRLDSEGAQIPWESTSLEGDFYFIPPQPNAKSLPMTLPAPPGVEQIARAEQAYEDLRQGKLDQAEQLFGTLAAAAHPDVAWMGREGLAEIKLKRGDAAGALADADAIIAVAPTRSAAYLIRSRALAATGQAQASASALAQAASDRTQADFSWQKSGALVAVGNAEQRQNPQAAIQAYEKATREDRQSVAALSNLAVALNQTGQGARAKALLERAQSLDPADALTAALLRQTQEALAADQDRARQSYIDGQVKELAQRFAHPLPRPPGSGAPDDWTSPVMAVSVLPFQDLSLPGTGGRIGLDTVLQQEVIRELQARGYTVVERRLLDKVLAEINLGSSALADPDTQVKLGQVLAARMIVSGVLSSQGTRLGASVRAIDTETTRLAMVRNEPAEAVPSQDSAGADPTRLAALIAQDLATTLHQQYPLKGRIVEIDGDRAILNLGRKHGVSVGQNFNVLSRGEPIELNGRILGYKESKTAQVTITEVQDLLSYARIADARATPEKNQRVIARQE
jgi:hypothetical protein